MSDQHEESELAPKEERFVQEYLISLNAADAARKAGYSPASAKEAGYRLLTYAHVKAEIDRRRAEIAQKYAVTAERVIAELAMIGFSNLGDMMEFGEDGFRFKPGSQFSDQARRAVSSIKVRREMGGEDYPPADVVEIKLWNKIDALTKLATHLGLLKEKPDDTTQSQGESGYKIGIYLPENGRDTPIVDDSAKEERTPSDDQP